MLFDVNKESFAAYAERLLRNFSNDQKYIIWGAGEKFRILKERDVPIIAVVDSDKAKQGLIICGEKVNTPSAILKFRQCKVIIAAHQFVEIENELKSMGYAEDEYCRYNEYITVVTWFKEHRILIPEINLYLINQCNLRCKGCIVGMPYQNSNYILSLEDNLLSIGNLFWYADEISNIILTGGEVMLNQQDLKFVIDFLYKKYSDRFHSCSILTNGTILPNPEQLHLCRKYNIKIEISNYIDKIGNKSKLKELTNMLKKWGINYHIESNFSRYEDEELWYDMGDGKARYQSNEALQQIFSQCRITCVGLCNSMLYNCSALLGAILNRNYSASSQDYFNIKEMPESDDDYLRFIKYCLGYCDDGYYQWCDCCNGFSESLNSKTIPAGEQI